MAAIFFFLLYNLLSYICGGITAFANWAVEVPRLYECLHKDIFAEGHLRCMSVGFPFVPCLSMKHVADGRRGFYLLHPICLCWSFLFVKIPFPCRFSRVFTALGEWRTDQTSGKKASGRTAQTIPSEETSRKSEYRTTHLLNCVLLRSLETLLFLCPELKHSVVFSKVRKRFFLLDRQNLVLLPHVPFCVT